jgi:holliday junction DNA helicase RuvA
LSTFSRLGEIGHEFLLYLSHVVREDSETLYAFSHKEERDLFEILLSISGIGPKTSLSIIGHIEAAALKSAVASSDLRLLSQIPGIGKKTAERLVMELRDKLKTKQLLTSEQPSLTRDAIAVLTNLGYSPIDAQKAVQQVKNGEEDEQDLSKLIAAALRSTTGLK